MRYVDRQSVEVPNSLTDPHSPASSEKASASAYYGQTPPPSKCYGFKEYKAEDVVNALESLFHKKCAYCETKYAASQPMDVEHYRPKGAVAEDETHPGYWWLALEWTNLLPSCIDCNRKRRQYIIKRGAQAQTIATEKTLAGKKDSFPIDSEQRACRPGDDLELEGALLIDPTACDPIAHLQWRFDDVVLPLVLPKEVNGQKDNRGSTSVDVFGLNRQALVEERGSLLLELAVEVKKIREVLEMAAQADADPLRQQLIEKAKAWIWELRRHSAGNARYSALATAYIQHAMREIQNEFGQALLFVLKNEQQK